MLLMVSYDLHRKPESNYENLIRWLVASKAERILYSQWLIETTWSAVQVRDACRQHIASDDLLMVTEVTNPEWATGGGTTERALAMLRRARACG